jgi:arsenate reductase
VSITVYGIKNCDTMKKALRWLDEQGLDYHFHDYKKEGVPEEALQAWISQLGWETVINRRGTTWRKLPEEVRDDMDAVGAVSVALNNPSIIKRPILDTGRTLLAGFKAHEWERELRTAG